MTVPDVDLRVLAPADNEGVVDAAEARADDVPPLLLAAVPATGRA